MLILAALAAFAAQARAATLAVLYFENAGSSQLDPLKVGLAQMLVSDLRGTPGITVIERSQLQAIMDELKLGHSGVVDPATAAKVGKLLGADTLLLGSYFELMGTLRVDARLVRVESGEIVLASGANDSAQAFMAIERTVASAFRTALTAGAAAGGPNAAGVIHSGGTGSGAAPAIPAISPTPSSTEPGNFPIPTVIKPDSHALEAAVAYSEGLISLDTKDVARAREAFSRALDQDPSLDAAKAELAKLDL